MVGPAVPSSAGYSGLWFRDLFSSSLSASNDVSAPERVFHGRELQDRTCCRHPSAPSRTSYSSRPRCSSAGLAWPCPAYRDSPRRFGRVSLLGPPNRLGPPQVFLPDERNKGGGERLVRGTRRSGVPVRRVQSRP